MTVSKKIIVWSRSKELNGINEIKRSLPQLDKNFIAFENPLKYFFYLIFNKNNIQAIFCLSNSDLIGAVFFTQILKRHIPLILGVYHPKQMRVSLDEQYSSARAEISKKILTKIKLRNMIFNSETAYQESLKILPFAGDSKNIIIAPSAQALAANEIKKIGPKKSSSQNNISIITVGRFVDFKVCTIFCMIDIVDHLNAQDACTLNYHIYGDGSLYEEIQRKISMTRKPENFFLHGILEPTIFLEVVAEHDLFFGMGFALTHAAMIGVPSLIAIQDEKSPVTYGFFSDYDQLSQPMFGDQTSDVEKRSLESELRQFIDLSVTQRLALGERCKQAWLNANSNELIMPKLMKVFNEAEYIEYEKISILDLVKMRIQTYFSRFFNKNAIHA